MKKNVIRERHGEKSGVFRYRGKCNLGAYVTLKIPRKALVSLLILSFGVIIYLSLLPPSDGPESENAFYEDKIEHVIAYCWLALLWVLAAKEKKSVFAGALVLIVLGVILEYGQTFIPGRMCSLDDMFANVFGVLIGVALGMYVKSRIRRQ